MEETQEAIARLAETPGVAQQRDLPRRTQTTNKHQQQQHGDDLFYIQMRCQLQRLPTPSCVVSPSVVFPAIQSVCLTVTKVAGTGDSLSFIEEDNFFFWHIPREATHYFIYIHIY